MKIENRVCANTASLPVDQALVKIATNTGTSMDRREALKATACSVAMIVAPAASIANPNDGDTAILRLFRQHREFGRWINSLPGDRTDEDDEPHFAKLFQIADEMMSLPSTCAADFAAKVIIDTVEGGCFSEWETGALWKEARALTGCPI